MKLIQYLFHLYRWQRLPKLPRGYTTDYETSDIDEDTRLLMRTSHVRAPHATKLLKERHKRDNAVSLLPLLPTRRYKRSPLRKLIALIRRAAGTTAYDPMQSISRQYTRRARRR